MTVFLDCGSHNGHTLEEVTKPQYDFDLIIGFEPMPREYLELVERFGKTPRVRLYNFGLSDRTGSAPVYGTNDNLGASLFAAKNDVEPDVITECDFVEASEFVRQLESDDVILKLNCEGAEVPILHNLIDTGAIHRLRNVMIDWDVRKIPGMEREEQAILARLAAAGFDRVSLCDNVMVGPDHQARIANWLSTVL